MKRFQLVILCLLAAACSPKVENHGYMKQGAIAESLTVGLSTKDDVLSALGTPSAQSSFGEDSWYYISSRRETVAFFEPEVAEQEVVSIAFDENGVVSRIDAYDKEQAKSFDVVKRITPTEGHSLGIMEQLLGNLGRFNTPGRKPTGPPGGF